MIDSQAYDKLRLRITVWPGQPLPVPELVAWETELNGPWIEYRKRRGRESVSDELYLRELPEVDSDDPEAVYQFVKNWGPLARPVHNPFRPNPGWLDLDIDAPKDLVSIIEKRLPDELVGQLYGDKWAAAPRYFNHIEEAALYIRTFQFMVSVFTQLHQQQSIDLGRIVWHKSLGWFPDKEWLDKEGVDDEGLLALIAPRFSDWLTKALQPIQPYISYMDAVTKMPSTGGYPANITNNSDLVTPRTLPETTLYTAMAVQLFNHVAENAAVQQCANESCERFFVRQRGRSKFGQYRTQGVKYCSSSCAKAQAQRKLRKRQAEARRLHRNGLSAKEIAEKLRVETISINRWIRKG